MTESDSTNKKRSNKFPLTLHRTSRYCKKIWERITPQSLTANSRYGSGDWFDLRAQAYVVEKPAAGVWTTDVTGGAEPDCFMLLVSAEDTFVLSGSTDKYFNSVGQEVKLRATLDVDTTVADVRVDITDPNGSTQTVVLHDDGLHDDASPDDGLFGNVFTPSLEGEYTLVFSAKGTVGGKEFSRADMESIFVNVADPMEQ